MKLLFLSPYPLRSGITSAYIQNYIHKYTELGYSVIHEKMYFWENKLVYTLKWIALVRYAFFRNMLYVAHQHTIPASGPGILFFLLMLKLFGKKAIVVSHETTDTYAKHLPKNFRWIAYLYEKLIVTFCSYYVVHTRFHKNESEFFKSSDKVRIIPHPVPKVTLRIDQRSAWGFYGMVSRKKGVDLIIQAYQSLPAGTLPELRIMGAAAPGEEKYLSECKNSIKEEYRSSIQFTGFVLEEHKTDLFADIALMIFPYRYVSQSGALAETCMYRIPYLASDIPFFKDFNATFSGGVLFTSERVDSIVHQFETLSKKPLQFKSETFDHIEKELSIEKCAGEFVHLFNNEEK